MTGRLILAGTPIGNVDDASLRLRTLLTEVTVIAAEDTRRLHALTARMGITTTAKVVSYHEHNETQRADDLLDLVEAGQDVLVVTDAGMPSVSDPGYRIVARAIERDLPVTSAPGPSAVLTALAVSGLPTDRFCFEGFPPRKPGERTRAFAALAAEKRTLVFFESPHRIAATLAAMAQGFGPERPAAVCRELTKTYEEVIRGPLSALAERASAEQLRGEIAIVIAGAPENHDLTAADVVDQVTERIAQGERMKQAVAEIAELTGVSKRELYEAALAAKSRG